MKTFRKRSKHPRQFGHSPRSLLTALAIGVLLLIFFAAVLWRNQIAGLLWQAATPLLGMRNTFAISQTTQLEAELTATRAMLVDRNMLYQENLQLKARLGRDAGIQTILVGVLMRPPAMPYDTLMIDAGLEQGIAEGQFVSAGGTTLIGRIAQVYPTTARVVLFSAPGQTYSALLSLHNGSAVPIEVEGQGAGSLVARIPAKTAVAVGDAVVFPGITGGFSSVVSHIDARDSESFETLYMHLAVDPLTLRYIEVWRQKNATQ